MNLFAYPKVPSLAAPVANQKKLAIARESSIEAVARRLRRSIADDERTLEVLREREARLRSFVRTQGYETPDSDLLTETVSARKRIYRNRKKLATLKS